MINTDQKSIFTSDQLQDLLNKHPSYKFIGLKITKEDGVTTLHSIFIEKNDELDELPFHALVTVSTWEGKGNEEEFFLEAMTAHSLIVKLHLLDQIELFTFFKAKSTTTMAMVNMYPQPLFCQLFPELGAYDMEASDSEKMALKRKSEELLTDFTSIVKNH